MFRRETWALNSAERKITGTAETKLLRLASGYAHADQACSTTIHVLKKKHKWHNHILGTDRNRTEEDTLDNQEEDGRRGFETEQGNKSLLQSR
jgi:hypothetical protein